MEDQRGTQRPVASWEDLDVWRVAHGLALKVYEVTRALPNEEKWRLGD